MMRFRFVAKRTGPNACAATALHYVRGAECGPNYGQCYGLFASVTVCREPTLHTPLAACP